MSDVQLTPIADRRGNKESFNLLKLMLQIILTFLTIM